MSLHGIGHPKSEHATELPGSRISSPAGHPLPERVLISRALRPLRRWVSRYREEGIDEEATAERIAEARGVPCLVPRLVPERDLDLCMIVERTPTMDLWGKTLDDFQLLLRRMDAFRRVERYDLDGSGSPSGELRLVRPGGYRPVTLQASLGCARSQLICLFTDGISQAWRDGRIQAQLAEWRSTRLTTVFQMLPVLMWPGTVLHDLPIAYVHARRAGCPAWDDERRPVPAGARPQPVLVAAFSAPFLHAWARTLGACSSNRMTALVLRGRQAAPPLHSPGPQTVPGPAEFKLPDPKNALETFRACASPIAWQLAGLLAAAPLYPPVMRLVQQALLPGSTREHLAEVLMGGLIYRPPQENEDGTPPEETLYEFVGSGDPDNEQNDTPPQRPGVRELLLDQQWNRDLCRVLEAVSEHVEHRLGRVGLDFKAILEQPRALARFSVSKRLRPFARVGAAVLQRLGGEHALAGERLAAAVRTESSSVPAPRPGRYALLLDRAPQPSPGLAALERVLSHPDVGNFVSVQRHVFGEERESRRHLEAFFDGRVAGDLLLVAAFGPATPTVMRTLFEEWVPSTGVRLAILLEDAPSRARTSSPSDFSFSDLVSFIASGRPKTPVFGAIAQMLESGWLDRRGKGVVTLEDLQIALSADDFFKPENPFLECRVQEQAKPIILARNPRYRCIPELGLELLRIPARRFKMGSPKAEAQRDSDETQHDVVLTHDYWMGTTPVTQSQYEALMGTNPSHFNDVGPDAPVETVSWDDAVEFCRKLTQREREAGRLPEGMIYTLPTEAEWEYACRAGTETPFAIGDGQNLSPDQANFDGNYPYGPEAAKGVYRERTTPVKSFAPNQWGLYDTHGNVREWCEDWFANYPEAEVTNPLGPSEGSNRVQRGGSWDSDARWCRSAYRVHRVPDVRDNDSGFRVAAVQAVTRNRTRAPEAPRDEGGAEVGKGPRALEFVEIPPGDFVMGSPTDEAGRHSDETQHKVTITRPFRIGKYPVTQHQYEQLMGTNPSHFKHAGPDAPVEGVSWYEAIEFCRRLTEAHYASGQLSSDMIYALPTEAQWEYACRAGSQGAIYTDERWEILGQANAPALDPIAWYGGNSGVDYEGGVDSSGLPEKQFDHKQAGTHPVGLKWPNRMDLFDMLGNVWEWCWDWYGPYPSADATDPLGPAEGSDRVQRGGCWFSIAGRCRSAFRDHWVPVLRYNSSGFRVAAVQAGERSEARAKARAGEGRARSPAEQGAAPRPEPKSLIERVKATLKRKQK